MTQRPIFKPSNRPREGHAMPLSAPRTDETPTPKASGPRNSPSASVSYSCGGCDNRWTGVSRAHCDSCHESFGGVDLFDRHRRDVKGHGICLDPATIVNTKTGLREMFLTDGLWRGVEKPTVSNFSRPRTDV